MLTALQISSMRFLRQTRYFEVMRQLALGFIGAVLAANAIAGPDLLTRPAALIFKCTPLYTSQARSARLEGKVVLYIQISRSGIASHPKVIQSLGMGLDERAIEAVKQWRFRPGTKDGKVVVVPATVEVNFRLNDKSSPCPAGPPRPEQKGNN